MAICFLFLFSEWNIGWETFKESDDLKHTIFYLFQTKELQSGFVSRKKRGDD